MPPVSDDHSRWGWTHPHEIGRTGRFIDLHKVGSLIATAATSLLISGGYAEAGQPSDEHINFGWNTTEHTSHLRTTVLPPVQMSESSVSTRIVPGQTPARQQVFTTSAADLPDVTSFNLDTTPEAQVVINNASFTDYITSVVQQIEKGWTVQSVVINGKASDETRLDGNAGIESADPENLSLAAQYQAFVRQATLEALAEKGVTVPSNEISGTPREVVLSETQVAAFEAIRARTASPDNLALIELYKTQPERLSAADHEQLAAMFDANRGADITITLNSPAGTSRSTTYETTTSRCVTVETTIETTVRETKRDHHNIPVMLIPLPIARVRRQKSGRTIQEPVPQPSPEPEKAASKSKIPEYARYYGVRKNIITDRSSLRHDIWMINTDLTSQQCIAELMRPITGDSEMTIHTAKDTERMARLRELAGHYDLSDGTDQDIITNLNRILRRQRAVAITRRIGGLSAAAVGLAAIPLFVRGDVGYCPEPQDHLAQNWRWNDIPDYLDLRLHVPFTGIDSARSGDLAGGTCRPDQSAPGTPQPGSPTEPSCDSRQVVIRDGRVIDNRETHYPGALTQSTRTVTSN